MESGFVSFGALLHCGVYMLVRRREVVYVGKSKSLHARLNNHCSQRRNRRPKRTGMFDKQFETGFAFDDIWVQPCMLGELDSLEIAMIKKYQPRYNIKHKDVPKIVPDISIEELMSMIPTLPAIADAIQRPTMSVYRRF